MRRTLRVWGWIIHLHIGRGGTTRIVTAKDVPLSHLVSPSRVPVGSEASEPVFARYHHLELGPCWRISATRAGRRQGRENFVALLRNSIYFLQETRGEGSKQF